MTLSKSVAAWKSRQPNGEIPFEELQSVAGTWDVDLGRPCHFMPEAARSFEAMRKAMWDDIHVALKPSRSYRTLPDQKAKYAAYLARGKTPPIVAYPGTSNHGEALAGDMGFATFSDARYVWLKNHAAAYGWHQNDAPSEPWHWDYEGDYNRDRFNFEEDDDMGYEDFKTGVRLAKDGKQLPANANTDVTFGFNMEKRATSLPKPGAPAPHDHLVELKGRTKPGEVIG